MLYIALCIIFSTGILIIFKLASSLELNVFRIILVNYLVATLLGVSLALPIVHSFDEIRYILPFAICIGLFFIALFFLVGRTTAISGMTITSIASKMSVVIPASFSIIYYKESLGPIKSMGIIMAILALFMAVYKERIPSKNLFIWLLPIVLFFGNGILDSILKYAQEERLGDFDLYLFNSIVFGTALISGLIIAVLRPNNSVSIKVYTSKELALGVLLGLVNFGSLFAMINALNSEIDSSLVFLLNNTGVVMLAALTGALIFKEKLSSLNLLGILLALVSIILMSLHYNG